MSENSEKCPICGTACSRERGNGVINCHPCSRCGHYYVSVSAEAGLRQMPEDEKALFTSYLCHDAPRGGEKLGHGSLPGIIADHEASEADPSTGERPYWALTISEIKAAVARYDALTRLDRCLLFFAARTKYPGARALKGDNQSYRLTKNWHRYFCESQTAAEYVERCLFEQGLIQDPAGSLIITAKGWEQVRELRGGTLAESSQGFVAMWFTDDMDTVYKEGLKPGVTAAGYVSYRVKGEAIEGKVDDRIMAEIRRSRFIVADVTGNRSAVYYEAGFAHGLGLPVFLTCRKDRISEDMCFDTQTFQHIVWETPEDLREQLKFHIEARIDHGPVVQ